MFLLPSRPVMSQVVVDLPISEHWPPCWRQRPGAFNHINPNHRKHTLHQQQLLARTCIGHYPFLLGGVWSAHREYRIGQQKHPTTVVQHRPRYTAGPAAAPLLLLLLPGLPITIPCGTILRSSGGLPECGNKGPACIVPKTSLVVGKRAMHVITVIPFVPHALFQTLVLHLLTFRYLGPHWPTL